MAEWEGFTEEDLKRFQSGGHPVTKASRPKILKPISKKNSFASSAGSIKRNQQSKKNEPNPEETSASEPTLLSPAKNPPMRSKSVGDPTHTASESPAERSECIFDDKIIQKKEKLKLEDVQQRQKQMEERNKRKKQMLTKEIAERKKKALAESSKLINIQQELAKLDELLNFDVSILRDKIDDACMEFSHAQKRFDKAEAEYVSAKLDLHKKTMMKEDLTEHLFNLIQVNEERKARKLEELMHKLDVEEADLEVKGNECVTQVEARSSDTENPCEQLPPTADVKPDNLHGGNDAT